MKEFNVPESEYDILPFPINCPEYLLQYVPNDAVYYMGVCDAWDEEKNKILRSLGLKTEILWRKKPEDKGITASWVRSCIATDHEWAHLVPKLSLIHIFVRSCGKSCEYHRIFSSFWIEP